MEKETEPKHKVTFIPTISFDGIAMIVGIITCSIWMGALSQTVRDHSEEIRTLRTILESQAKSQELTDKSLAILSTLVNERTKK